VTRKSQPVNDEIPLLDLSLDARCIAAFHGYSRGARW
jgi:hypothetical protein